MPNEKIPKSVALNNINRSLTVGEKEHILLPGVKIKSIQVMTEDNLGSWAEPLLMPSWHKKISGFQ